MSDDESKPELVAATAELDCKAGRLRVAAQIAPTLRSNANPNRKIARVDAKGNVVGYTTLGKVQESLLEAKKIEIEVVDGATKKEIICERCGMPAKVTSKAQHSLRCRRCSFPRCDGCGKQLGNSTSTSRAFLARAGRPSKCAKCYGRSKIKYFPTCIVCNVLIERQGQAPSVIAARSGSTPRCDSCKMALRKTREQQAKCHTCGKHLSSETITPSAVRRRGGAPPLCRPCYSKNRALK